MVIKILSLFLILLISCQDITSNQDLEPVSSGEIMFISLMNKHEIILADKDGSNQFAITGEKDAIDIEPVFSGDGDKVIFSSYVKNSISRSLFEYDIKINKRIKITDDGGNDCDVSASKITSKILFTSDRNNSHHKFNIFVLDMDTKKIKQITQTEDNYYNPQFSPEDSKILFSKYKDGLYHLCSVESNGSNLVEYGTSTIYDGNPKFSLNGDKVFYTADKDLFSINLDGTNLTNYSIDTSETIYSYIISPIDFIIYYSTINNLATEYKIFKLNINTLEREVLKETGKSTHLYLSDCSSDGKTILYCYNFDVFIMEIINNQEINITNSNFVDCNALFWKN